MAKEVILLTGPPGIGKTTILRDVISSTIGPYGGFYTLAVSESGMRTRFDIVTLDGKRAVLAEKTRPNMPMVGSYHVNIEALDSIAVPALKDAMMTGKTVVVDEIGPMEVLSTEFRLTISGIVANPDLSLLGTIVQRQCDFADELKAHPRLTLIDITRENRNRLRAQLHSLLQGSNVSPKLQR